MNNPPHIAARLFNIPLMISRAKLDTILAVMGPRFSLEMPIQEGALDFSARRRDTGQHEGTAIIPVHGTLVHRSMGLEALSGLTSYQTLAGLFNEALENDSVSHIVLDIDSPGGEVSGLFDFVDSIYRARGKKPITAIVNEAAHSAAYAIASAADEIIIPRTGGVGSIGVIASHVDKSAFNEKAGFKVTTVFAGNRKNDFNPNEPVSDEALSILHGHIQQTYQLFVDTVARNLGLPEKAVKDTQAGIFIGKSAVKAGLAHKVASADDALRLIVNRGEKMTTKAEGAHPVAEQANTGEKKTAEVVDFKAELEKAKDTARLEAEKAAKARAQAITELCQLAEMPHLAGNMISSDFEVDKVRAALVDEKAKAAERYDIQAFNTGGQEMNIPASWGQAFKKVGK